MPSGKVVSYDGDIYLEPLYDAILAAGWRYVGPDEVAATRLAGKVEGMEAAIEVVQDVCWCEPETVEAAIRAKITELKASSTDSASHSSEAGDTRPPLSEEPSA